MYLRAHHTKIFIYRVRRKFPIDSGRNSFAGHEYLQLGSDIPLQNLKVFEIASSTDGNLFKFMDLYMLYIETSRIHIRV